MKNKNRVNDRKINLPKWKKKVAHIGFSSPFEHRLVNNVWFWFDIYNLRDYKSYYDNAMYS